MNFVDVLNVFADLEMRISGFYEDLAEMFDDDQDVSEFWLQMSGEEIEHADALKSAAESLPETEPPPSERPLIEPEIIRKLSREITICEEVMTRHNQEIDKAFECALFLESSELNDIYHWLLEKIPLHWTETLSSLTDGASEHIIGLCEEIERYTQDQTLLERAQALRYQLEEYGFRHYITVHKSMRVRSLREEEDSEGTMNAER
jgi:rubrerythrin